MQAENFSKKSNKTISHFRFSTRLALISFDRQGNGISAAETKRGNALFRVASF
jgi:hypothetical protein